MSWCLKNVERFRHPFCLIQVIIKPDSMRILETISCKLKSLVQDLVHNLNFKAVDKCKRYQLHISCGVLARWCFDPDTSTSTTTPRRCSRRQILWQPTTLYSYRYNSIQADTARKDILYCNVRPKPLWAVFLQAQAPCSSLAALPGFIGDTPYYRKSHIYGATVENRKESNSFAIPFCLDFNRLLPFDCTSYTQSLCISLQNFFCFFNCAKSFTDHGRRVSNC